MSSLARRIAQRLVEARKAARLTQEEVARKADVTTQYISRLERAIADAPRRLELEKVASVFGMTADDLMGLPDDDPSAGRSEGGAESFNDLVRQIRERTGERQVAIGLASIATNWQHLSPSQRKLIEAAYEIAMQSPEGPEDISKTEF